MNNIPAIHSDSIVFDLHQDTLSQINDTFPEVDLVTGEGAEGKKLHVTLPRLRAGGIDAVCWAIYTHSAEQTKDYTARALAMIGRAHRLAQRDGIRIARTAGDIRAAKEAGDLAVVLTIENAVVLNGRIDLLYSFYEMGVRMLGLVWNTRNELGAGFMTAGEGETITKFGRDVVKEAAAMGMLIDVAHLSDAGVRSVLETTDGPVVSSHTNARGACDFPRNHMDETVREIAARGGVLGLNFCPKFLNNSEKASLGDVVRMISHMAEAAGSECVAIGSDYDGINHPPAGLDTPDMLPNLTEALIKEGFSENAVRGILGENALRVFENVCG